MAEIIDITTPWEGKTGKEVETVIKGTLNAKHGASYFDPTTNTMLYFASKEAMAEWLSTGNSELVIDEAVMNFTGTMYQVKVQSEMPSKNLYFTTQADKAEITVSFLSQKKGITDVSWQDIVEDYNVSVYVDKGGLGTFTPLIVDQFVISGNTFTFDVKKALATGANRVRVVAVGTESADKAQGSEMFIVNLTSMYLAPSNFTWYKPFIEGETYALGGMNIGGNLNKTLKIKVSKEGYERLYEVAIGSNIYTNTAYVYNGLEFPAGGTGVYNVDIWLDANGLESDHLSYNIICVSQADRFTAQLVAIGDPAKTVFNFSDNKLFEYCVYNGGTATATPHIKVAYVVNTNPTTIIDEDLVDVATASPLTYTASLEIEMEDESAALQLETLMTYGNEQMIVFPVDNSKSYPATTGAVFYMNPSARNNAQSNREKVINSITGAEIDAVFTRMAWTDGTDGWTTDDEGRKCLRLPAGCTMDVAYQPMASVAQKTIELVYKVKNAADYDEPIFSICSDVNDPQFRGIVIRPKNILIHSRDLNVNDSLQDYNTTDEETLHVLITIIPNYKTNYGNLAQIYVNGDKVRSFSFETADRWDVTANMKFGSTTADTCWYKARVYDRGFESYDALKNYINSLPSTKAKEEAKLTIEAPLDDSYKVSYDECVKNGLNTMVIEIKGQDQTVPSIANPSAKTCNTWIKINNPIEGELDEDFARLFSGEIIEGETIEGQGTTAMTYARWNFRWKLSSKYNKRRITAKKNVASSPHDNKMGATRLFNDLYMAIVGENEAGARVAVYQYPVYGFQKILVEGTTDQYLYEFIGLYTIGPDKGDKPTFGYDDERFEDSLIHMEGTDHTPKGIGYDYPWEELAYSNSSESLGAVNASGAVVAAFEVGTAGKYDPKDDPSEVKAMLDEEFKPAYNVVELNSTYILGVTESLAEMNANISAWQTRIDAKGRSYADLQFFTDGVYDLYFYNIKTQQYAPRGINMLTDLGLTADDVAGLSLDEKTELFKTKRRERFKANCGDYWKIIAAIFVYSFQEILGITDNLKKNTYWKKFKKLIDGGKWDFNGDDFDTLFDINNQGLAAKIYSILVGDKTDTGSGSIFRGDTSVFWTLIRECFPTEIKEMVHAIFDKMVEMSPYGNNTLEKLVGCIRYYFWDKAQAYFPASAYSKDAEWTYEDTWAAGLYKEVNPLQQSLGGHYEAQVDWVTMRMLFCAMYFNYGPFGAVNDSFSDTSTGQIAYGGAGAKTYVITMACDGNPTILRGQSELVTFGDRVKAGETIELTVPDSSGADTRIYIQGVDWMEDIGDLSDLQVSADNPQLSVASKRLQRLKIGDEDASKVSTNVEALNFGACPSMMIIDARNAKSLTGSIDLSKMPRLMEAYFGGTGVKAVNVPNGSKIAVLELGEETTQISLMNLKFMELEGFRYSELPKLEFLRIENCSQLNPVTMLKEIYNTEGNVIRDIRIIGFDVDGDASDVTMIANLANDVDKDGNPHTYNGIDAEGKPMDNSHPIIEGRIRINGNIYEEDYEALKAVFSNLAMEFLGFYCSYADPNVLSVLIANGVSSDGVGITAEDEEKVTSISYWFSGNTIIETFDELGRFVNVTALGKAAFKNCTLLKSIDISRMTELDTYALSGCAALEYDILSLPNLTKIGQYGLNNVKIRRLEVPNLVSYVSGNNNISTWGDRNLLEEIVLSSNITSLNDRMFYQHTALRLVEGVDWSKIATIGTLVFYNCTALEFDELNLPSLTTLGQNAFYGVKIKKLSLGVLTTLPTALSSTQNFGDKSVLEEVVLPNITSISKYSFYGYTALSKVGIDWSKITTIEEGAFRNCKSLSMIVNCPNLTSIGNAAFLNTSVEKVIDLGAVTTLCANQWETGTFRDCKQLQEVTLPTTITSLGFDAFYNCSSLRIVKCLATTPPAMGNVGVFTGVPSSCIIYVPDGDLTQTVENEDGTTEEVTKSIVEWYKEATNWSTYADRIYPMSVYDMGGADNMIKFADPAVEAIVLANWDNGDGYFMKSEAEAVTGLQKKFFSNNEITSFDEFKNFTNVSKLDHFWTGQNNKGQFSGCSNLTSIELPDSVTYLGIQSFYGCTSLNHLVANGVTNISASALSCGDGTLSVSLPSLTGTVDRCFQGSGIKRVEDLGTITELVDGNYDRGAFFNSAKLEFVALPATITKIGNYAFTGCSALKTIVCRAIEPPTLGSANPFTNVNIYVPDESVDSYKEASNWSSFASSIKPLSEYTE